MISADVEYIKKILRDGLIKTPCLELGVGYGGENNKELLLDAGISYFGTDIVADKDVDFVVNFEAPPEIIKKCFDRIEKFETILVLNVLEHTFDPIRVLDNVFSILRPGGVCIIITPAIWPLHSYPRDYWRINPDFYEEYCKLRKLHLLNEYFEYIAKGKIRGYKGTQALPKPSKNKYKVLYSRVIHKLFNTYGRGMLFPSHVAIGVVIRK